MAARKRKYHSNLAGPYKKKGKKRKASKKRKSKKGKRKAKRKSHSSVASHMKAANRAGVRYGEKVTAAQIVTRAKRRRGKRWVCGGPVRSGCGGSDSRVVS